MRTTLNSYVGNPVAAWGLITQKFDQSPPEFYRCISNLVADDRLRNC